MADEELSELRNATSLLHDIRSTLIILLVLNGFALVATFLGA